MGTPAITPKPKCPECQVELEGDPDVCAKCGFLIKDYRSFFRFFKRATSDMEAEKQAKEAAEKKQKEEEQKKQKRSTMDYIRGKK